MRNFLIALTVIFVVNSCNSENKRPQNTAWIDVAARDEQLSPIYRIKVPVNWKNVGAASKEAMTDTKLPIAEFNIVDNEGTIRITIHSFPSWESNDRIPPAAQIERWKRQFDSIDPVSVSVSPQAFSGYAGMLFECSGTQKQTQTSVMAWSLQLAPELYRSLSSNDSLVAQKRADITIKAQGDPALIAKYHDSIIQFARSFELIDPISLKS